MRKAIVAREAAYCSLSLITEPADEPVSTPQFPVLSQYDKIANFHAAEPTSTWLPSVSHYSFLKILPGLLCLYSDSRDYNGLLTFRQYLDNLSLIVYSVRRVTEGIKKKTEAILASKTMITG